MGKTGFVQKLLGTVRSGREVWSDLSLETFFFSFYLFIWLQVSVAAHRVLDLCSLQDL